MNSFSKIIFGLGVCALATLCTVCLHAQLPAGTVRKTMETDDGGVVLWPTNAVSSNQWKIVPAPTHAQHIFRFGDFTNSIAVALLTNGSNKMGAALNMGSQPITNCPGATNPLDVPNYSQVTTAIAGATNGMSPGALLTNGDIPMGAPLNMGAQKGTNAANGTASTDLASYGQVTGATQDMARLSANQRFTGTNEFAGVSTNSGTSVHTGSSIFNGPTVLGTNAPSYSGLRRIEFSVAPPSVSQNAEFNTNISWGYATTNSTYIRNYYPDSITFSISVTCETNGLLMVHFHNTGAAPSVPSNTTFFVDALSP